MREGFLSSYFEGVAVKRLSAVEADLSKSNQHEFNGVAGLKSIFGKIKKKFNSHYIYLSEDEGGFESAEGTVTWYDSRKKHPARTEYRLYFSTNEVTRRYKSGDLLLIGKRPDGTTLIIVAEQSTTIENQLLWLFGVEEAISHKFKIKDIEHNDIKLEFASRFILEELGIRIEEINENWLDKMQKEFSEYDSDFPPTKIFSEFARNTVQELDVFEEPDLMLVTWLDQEEMLFRTLERFLVSRRIKEGFGGDDHNVSKFFEFSLSVQNRRKVRAGQSLENHLEEIFKKHKIKYSRGRKTERHSRPDFIFPSIEDYHNKRFNSSLLTMLGAKSTCKDRWRQVLTEADRIPRKHLLTLQPAITENQTDEMKASSLQLVIPKTIHKTFSQSQQSWLMSLSDFLKFVKDKRAH